MPRHDLVCPSCNAYYPDSPLDTIQNCAECGALLEILWTSSHPQAATNTHPSERAVVWQHPQTGEVRWPGRNDVPMPERYAAAGFQRREFETARELEKFEKERNVRNEKLWYNSGNSWD